MVFRAAEKSDESEFPGGIFFRPTLELGKFPTERKIQLPPELTARIDAQERERRLVFKQ